jgi:hypothetical protein
MSKQPTQPPPQLAIRHRHQTETSSPSTPDYQPTNLRLWHNGGYFWRSHLQMHTHLQNWSTQCYSQRFAHALAPALSIARYVLPNTNVDIEPNLYLPSDPHSCPFDLSFDPYPAPPPLASHGCTSHTIGANITISSLPPKPLINPNSPDVLQIITANANTHLQNYERKKLGHTNKTDASASTITRGDTLIGNLLHRNMLLIPFVIDPLGRFGPLLQNFLFSQHSAPQLRFPPSRPNATQMYNKLL